MNNALEKNNRINRIKNFIAEHLNVFVGISIFYCTLLVYFLITKKPFIFVNDQLYQYDVFYREWFRLIEEFFKGNGLPMYSWNLYLGGDFYSSMTYYCVGDIFIILLYPLNLLIHNVKCMLIIETVTCTYLSAFFFYAYLKKKGIKNKTVITVAAIIYALGGHSVNFLSNYMFLRFYTFLPLLFLGIESYYQNNKTYLVSLSVAILFMQNFYLMYPTSIFLFMYCLCKEFCFSKEKRQKRFFKDVGRLLLAYLIGTCIAAVILIPAALSVLSNSRVGDIGEGGLFWKAQAYIHVLLSPISSPFPTFTGTKDMFSLNDDGHGTCIFIYIGIVYFISSVNYILKKENKSHLIMSLFLLAVVIFKPLSSVMHGFSEASFRWLFLVVFYLLAIGSEQLDKDEQINSKPFYIYIALSVFFVITLLLMGYRVTEFKDHYITIAFYIIVSILIWFCFIKSKKIGLILSACEIMILSPINVFVYNDFETYDERIDKDYIAYHMSVDEDLIYRYFISQDDIVPTSPLDLNIPMDYGFMSSKTYNTMYDNVTNKFNYLNNNYRHFIDITNPYSLNMLGTKYWITIDEYYLPSEFEFEYSYSLSDLKIYKNLNYKGFGYTQGKVDYLDNINELKDFEDTVFVDDNSISIPQSNKEYTRFNITEKGNNFLKGNITINDKNILFIPIPNNPGWKVMVNGNVVKTIGVNGGFIGIELGAGYNEIEMYFVSPGFKTGAVITFVGIVLFIISAIKKEKHN